MKTPHKQGSYDNNKLPRSQYEEARAIHRKIIAVLSISFTVQISMILTDVKNIMAYVLSHAVGIVTHLIKGSYKSLWHLTSQKRNLCSALIYILFALIYFFITDSFGEIHIYRKGVDKFR
jgi:dipeptide/tripeptide permease